MNITFEFSTRDDCLDQMVPSDLRKLVVERDQAEDQVIRLREEVRYLRAYGNKDCTAMADAARKVLALDTTDDM